MAHGEKHALITGSSRGIGRGIALALAESGVQVAIHYYQNEAAGLNLYIYRDEPFNAAVAFRSQKPDQAAMEMSIASLALGMNAMTQHYQVSLRRPPGK